MNIGLMLRLLAALRQLRARDGWTRAQLEAYRAEALRRLREHAYAHSPFYREFHRGLTGRPLHELPVLTKATMMERFDDFATDRAISLDAVREHVATVREDERFLDRYWVNATSGSTGRPGPLARSRH